MAAKRKRKEETRIWEACCKLNGCKILLRNKPTKEMMADKRFSYLVTDNGGLSWGNWTGEKPAKGRSA